MSQIDAFATVARRPAGGPRHLFQIVPDDNNDLAEMAHWVHVSNAGSLTVTSGGGQVVTFDNILPGWHAMEIVRVHATGTTASSLIGGW
ncbi:hypothetical protein ATO10_07997 [Actibacterium atlanticum]|uniref:Uncharacterized protein n=1 Tax=Actibacterium atlanticum TaxID=1461693 RepID=A0A058ZNE2_9RHOB|nr:hypothetical protein [Actibacterium atlanticum]KCV82316.1 hypothetical protein ATO10_07997 [Actibacterium atlanticum]